MSKLVLLQGGQAIPYALTSEQTVIGRLPECTIQLQSNMVSRKHAEVFKAGDKFLVKDLGSGNGTFLNGKKIEEPTELKHNDRLKLGPMLFRFELDEGPPDPEEINDNDFLIDNIEGSTIMGTASNVDGFGMLDVAPEAKLKGVLEISRNLAGSVEIGNILPKILDTLFRIFPASDRGSIVLKDPVTGHLRPAAQKHRNPADDETVKLSRTILNKVIQEKTGILSADASSDQQFSAAESISALSIRSIMCVPIIDLQGEAIGAINLDTQNPISKFKQQDLEILLAIAGQAGLTISNTRLYESHLQKQKQDNEMKIAHNVQMALLPETLPDIEGYSFFASYEAAQAVGGDYYDCFTISDNRLVVSFGDVAGKGVPASLVMSRIASVVQCTLKHETNVEIAMHTINNLMSSNSIDGRFVTYVLGVIDLNTHEVTFANGGHMCPLVRKADGSLLEVGEEEIGIPVGIMEDYEFGVVSYKIEPGETIVIYTDGVSEAMNEQQELYSIERLKEVVTKNSSDPEELGIAIREDVRQHANGHPQNDDITLMTFGRIGE
ncbi:MAG: SpoIIE family protein phosphatase [Planctomycetaceae bacterium]|nr:SpoIIE family protein phosphatase [Planctomycetaceae bacterium]